MRRPGAPRSWARPCRRRPATSGTPAAWRSSKTHRRRSSWSGSRASSSAPHSSTRPGALCWNELATPDLQASTAFYGELFGWAVTPLEASPEPYLLIKNGDANNGGIRELTPPGAPPHWLVYFGTEDLDNALDDVEQLGGTRIAGPIDIQMARIGVVQDPVGAVFALYAGELEP